MHTNVARSLSLAAVIAVAHLVAPMAQAQSYAFTPIARTTTTPTLAGVSCVGMNNHGLVVFRASANDVWKGDGTAAPAFVATSGNLCPSINDLGEIAYLKGHYPVMFVTSLVRNRGGVETILARTDVEPRLDTTHLPSLNSSGNAVYSTAGALGGGQGIYIGPGTIKVCDRLTDGDHCAPPSVSMNESDTPVWIATPGGTAGIYRGSVIPLIKSGPLPSGGTLLISPFTRPVLNNAGTVAFLGSFDMGGGGVGGIYTTDTGDSVTRVGGVPATGAGLSINASGAVAYRKAEAGGAGSGAYIGRPGASEHRIIGRNDPLDGSIVHDVFLWEESLNDDGQVAFWAQLADGRRGVYRADPQWLSSLKFPQKVPGCGPIKGTVKLTSPAPVGGLTIRLANTNPAADVPLQVVVAKGKTSASFAIDPDAVLVKTDGTITVSVAAQTRDRDLTVRPISVKALSVAPNPVVGGNPTTGTVQLDCAAPHDITVALSSKTPAVAHPAAPTLLIPAGTSTSPFPITTAAVAASKKVSIKAGAFGTTKSKALTVNP